MPAATPPRNARRSPTRLALRAVESAKAMTTTPPKPRPIPRAIQAFSRSLRTKWESSPTRSGWDVTRITDDATLTLTPSSFRDPIHRVKWVARIAPTPIMPSTSLRESANTEARFAKTNGTRIRDARPRRYRAIVMKGDVDQEMKMAEKDTDKTASAITA